MRLSMQRGNRVITIAPRTHTPKKKADLPLRFASRLDAVDFLRRELRDPSLITAARAAIARVDNRFESTRLRDFEVLERLGLMIASGQLRVWSAEMPHIAFSHVDRRPGDSHDNAIDVADLLPKPIVPPEYIIMANLECDALMNETSRLNSLLDSLEYINFGFQKAKSIVAPEYVTTALQTGQQIVSSVADYANALGLNRYTEFVRDTAESVVAKVYTSVGDQTVGAVTSAATTFRSTIESARLPENMIPRKWSRRSEPAQGAR